MGLIKEKASSHPSTNVSMDVKKVKSQRTKALNPPFPLHHAYYPSTFARWRIDFYNSIFNRLYPVKPWLFAASTSALYFYYSRTNPSSSILRLVSSVPLLRSLNTTSQTVITSLLTAYMPVLSLRTFLKWFVFNYKGYVFEAPKKPSLTTKIWAVCWNVLRAVAPAKLESCNALLPSLPVPPLKKTVQGYLESVQPVLPKNEFDQLQQMADQFLSNEGKKLQRYTLFYSMFTTNYVTYLWEKYVYLAGRDCLLINSSVGHVDTFSPVPANQAVRAAHLIYVAALNMLAFADQSIKPPADGLVYTGHYRKLFGNTRIPGKYCDQWRPIRYSRHVAVYLDGCFYRVDLFDECNRLYSLDELADIFTELLCRRETASTAEQKLAALTHDKRNIWHNNRNQFFLKNSVNSQSLEVIESAIVFLILDQADHYDFNLQKPAVMDNFAREMLAGNGKNRWVDKSLNFVVSKNGRIGGTSEHSVGDGSEFDHVMENFLYIDANFLEYPKSVVDIDTLVDFKPEHQHVKLAERLRFEIDEEMKAEIDRSFSDYQPFKEDLDLVTLVQTDFGKGLIKKGRCTPDAFVQMAIQLANYKDQGKFGLTYEATSGRFYSYSRTETLRSVTKESCAFVKAMLNNSATDSERLKLLRQACVCHYKRNRLAMTGQAIDRHLFVLYVMSQATNTKSPFLQHYVSQKWLLSTSQPPVMTGLMDEDGQPETSWVGANFGAVAKDGYGLCYRFMGNHSLAVHITSYKSAENTDSQRFRQLLSESLRQMADLFNERANA